MHKGIENLKNNSESDIRKEAKSKIMIYLASNNLLKESLKDAPVFPVKEITLVTILEPGAIFL